jgi:glycosyltransferase involved in cell wall biosynthesis
MNLLFYLSRYPGWGGIETVTYTIVPELLKLGYKVDIVSHRQEMEAQSAIPDVTLYKMPEDTFYSAKNVECFKQIMANNRYDAIIYQDCYEATERIVVEMSQLYNVPLLVFEHNTPLYSRKSAFPESIFTLKGIAQRIYYIYLINKNVKRDIARKKYLYENCYKYVMLSKQYIPEIKTLLGIHTDNSKFTFINNPIVPIPKDVNTVKQNEILYVGQLVNIKNVSKILRLWAKVNSDLPEYKLTIVGDGPEREKLEKYANDKNLPRVTFEGYQRPAAYFRRAKFLLMTSKFEGWGMTLFEAMSVGCLPMAEHTFSALVDVIDDNVDGFIMPDSCSLNVWRKKLIAIAHDDKRFRVMSRNAEEKVQHFLSSKIALDWDDLLKDLNAVKTKDTTHC